MAEAILDMSAWNDLVRNLYSRLNDGSRYLRAAAAIAGFKDIQQHFKDEKGPDAPWEKRKSSTQLRYEAILSGMQKPPQGMPRAAFNPTNKILQMTGTLRQSLIQGNGGIANAGKNAIMLFTNVEYARAHDQGIPGRLPKREFMYLSDKGQTEMMDLLMNMITEGL